MVDSSTLPFQENVLEVKEIVKIAYSVGVSVEAELGHVGVGNEYYKTRDSGLTNPKEAIEYAKQTNVDCLAVEVGTSHGTYKEEPRLDFELLQKLNSILDVPLVLHGGSGTGDDNLKRTIKTGIQKVNLFVDLNKQGMQHLNAYLTGVNNEPVKSELQSDKPRSEFDDNPNINIFDSI